MMTPEKLRDACLAWDEAHKDMDVVTRDSMILERVFDETPIADRSGERFFHDPYRTAAASALLRARTAASTSERLAYAGERLLKGSLRRAYSGWYDFGHTAPDYDDIFTLGLPGLLARLEKCAESAVDEEARLYYAAGIRTWRAALRYVRRAAEQGNEEQKTALIALCERPPQSLYEAMQLSLVYYTLQHRFETTIVRTLGRLDHLYLPFLERDLADGRLDEQGVLALLKDFLTTIDGWSISANIPFALGGSNADGKTAVNRMSYLILQAYTKLCPPFVKLHVLYTDDMPKDFVTMAMDSVRRGANSICFMGDETVRQSLIRLGEDEADARNYAVVGCYECGGREEVTCSCNARVNLVKALEAAMNNGCDMETGDLLGLPWQKKPDSFEALFSEFLRQTEQFCRCAMRLTDACERLYDGIHSSPIMSATYRTCVERGRDIYCGNGAKYTNSSLNAFGMATAVDSLNALRTLVYEEKALSLDEMCDILRDDWQGHDALRLRVLHRLPKFGTKQGSAERLAATIIEKLSEYVNGQPNVKNGIWRLGTFSINWRREFGSTTPASADGRAKGAPLSQNSGASFGADTQGVTAHILAVTEQDHTLTPNGSVLDIDFHASAVRGDDGLAAMVATLATYMKRGGFAIHFNVLDSAVLREAMARPDDYPNLQVRLCGWNVRFADLSRREQEEFILRAERE